MPGIAALRTHSLAAWLRGLGFVLLALAFFPADHYPPWLSFHGEALAFMAMLALAWACVGQAWRLPRWWPLLAACLLLRALVWPCLSLAPACSAAPQVGSYLGLFLLAVVVGRTLAEQQGPQALALALSASLLVAALGTAAIVWMQWRLQDGLGLYMLVNDGTQQARGNVGQPNHAAILMVMGGVAALVCYEARRIGGATLALTCVFLALGVLMTESRTGLVALLLLGLWTVLLNRQAHLRLGRAGLWGGLVLLLLVVLLWGPLNQGLDADSRRIVAPNEIGLRPLMWAQMLAALTQAPLWGYGWLQTGQAQNQVAHVFDMAENTQYAHNLVLDLCLWNGVPLGMVLFAATVAWAWRQSRRMRSPLDGLALALLLPMAVHSMLEYPHAYAYFLLPAGLLVGLSESGRPNWALAGRWRVAWGLGLLGGTLWLAVLAWDYVQIEEEFRLTRFALMRIGRQPEGHVPYKPVIDTAPARLLQALRMPVGSPMSAEQLRILEQAATEFPMTSTLKRYARALALNGQAAESQRQLDVMRTYFGEATVRAVIREWTSP